MRRLPIALSMALVIVAAACRAQTSPDFDLRWNKLSVGGTSHAVVGDFDLIGTVGQLDAGAKSFSADGQFVLSGGFWPLSAGDILVSVPPPSPDVADARLELLGFPENPLRVGPRSVRFSVDATPGPTRLDVVDLNGRLVFSETWASLAPGPHAVAVGPTTRLQPGVYWLRVTHGAREVSRKAVVLN